jgi:hypothetical protein
MAEMYSACEHTFVMVLPLPCLTSPIVISLVGVILIARPAFIFGGQGGKVEEGATPAQRFTAVCLALWGVLGSAGACASSFLPSNTLNEPATQTQLFVP